MMITIKDIHYFPGHTHYVMVAEIPQQDPQNGLVVRDFEGKVTMHKDSKVHPIVARMMIQWVRDHIAQVNLD